MEAGHKLNSLYTANGRVTYNESNGAGIIPEVWRDYDSFNRE
jgi:hypothetical protein